MKVLKWAAKRNLKFIFTDLWFTLELHVNNGLEKSVTYS